MSIAPAPSKLSLPQSNPGVTTVLEYLALKHPAIGDAVWRQRMADGKVHWHDGTLINPDTAYQAQQRVYYYREVATEPLIPFAETIVYQDQDLLVAHKPHFLPVTVGGIYIHECLQNRLRRATGHPHLQALHRLDRATAGLVMFAINPATRHRYHHLFETRQVHKTYQAIARVDAKLDLVGQSWTLKNRLTRAVPRFRMQTVDGTPNSHSEIRCVQQSAGYALFELSPVTGKTHQLRVHMSTLGWPILHDRYYPKLQPQTPDCYQEPLQLLAKSLRFIDPITQQTREFETCVDLTLSSFLVGQPT